MPTLRLFAAAREAAGTARDELPGHTVAAVLEAASSRYGDRFEQVLSTSRVWVNGSPAEPTTPVGDADEVAVLPPVSGGER
ncbi:MAG TPA: MoaD/ThiS family protein [Acidimicrobiales bacterium]|nr:MoaD/ThiS family protein [Acidimicrobiales bacterium]